MTRLAFDPHVPLALIGALAAIAILITAASFALRARGADRVEQSIPVGVIGQHKASIDVAAPAVAANLHPA